MSKVALIVGVSGQTGAYLARHLLGLGIKVLGTSRDPSNANLWRLFRLGIADDTPVLAMSPQDFASTLSVLKEVKPNWLFFLGGQSSVGASFIQPFETLESIAKPVLNILEALRVLKLETRFVNSASSDMFGNQPGEVFSETSLMKPVSPYGVAKLASYWTTVQYREAFGLSSVNAILTNHESPLRGSQFFTSKMVRQLKEFAEGTRISLEFGNLSVSRDWLWAGDVARALEKIAQFEGADDFLVGSGESHALSELLGKVAEHFGVSTNAVLDKLPTLERPSEIQSVQLNPAKLRLETGWQPEVDFEQLAKKLAVGDLG